MTEEMALYGTDPMLSYAVAKTFAEKAVWKFADEHPEIDFTISTIKPRGLI